MTQQTLDTAYYRGTQHLLEGDPLGAMPNLPPFQQISTANLRGYIATWTIISNNLFLISLTGSAPQRDFTDISYPFPEARAPVHAVWFSGRLRLLAGRPIDVTEVDLHYESEVKLTVLDGVVQLAESVKHAYKPVVHIDPILRQPLTILADMGLTDSIVSHLISARLSVLAELVQHREADLMKLTGLTVDDVLSIREALSSLGLQLGTKDYHESPNGDPNSFHC